MAGKVLNGVQTDAGIDHTGQCGLPELMAASVMNVDPFAVPLKILIEGNLTKRYLHMIYKYRIWRYGYKKQIDRKLLWRTSVRMRDRAMVLLLYLFIH